MSISNSLDLSGIHLRAISQEMLKTFILVMRLKMSDLRLQPYLPGASELKWLFNK